MSLLLRTAAIWRYVAQPLFLQVLPPQEILNIFKNSALSTISTTTAIARNNSDVIYGTIFTHAFGITVLFFDKVRHAYTYALENLTPSNILYNTAAMIERFIIGGNYKYGPERKGEPTYNRDAIWPPVYDYSTPRTITSTLLEFIDNHPYTALLTTITLMFSVYFIADQYELTAYDKIRYYLSKFIHHANRLKSNPKTLIRAFRNHQFSPAITGKERKGGHSHEVLATNRSKINQSIETFIYGTGFRPYGVQMSTFDQKRGIDGSRNYYWPKDQAVKPRDDPLREYHIQTLIDVDYYKDMEQFLTNPVPTMLYTINPVTVAKTTEDYSYNFDKNNVFHYKVSGSGEYTHELWNWNFDHFTVKKRFWGVPYSSVTYQVDRRTVAPDRDVVLLTPMVSLGLLGTLISGLFLPTTGLSRLKVNQGPFNRLEIRSADKHTISTAVVDPTQYTSATVNIEDDNYFSTLSRIISTPLAPFHVTSQLKLPMDQSSRANREAAILVAYHNSRLSPPTTYAVMSKLLPKAIVHMLYPAWADRNDIVCPVEYSTRVYSFTTSSVQGLPILSPFMSPFLPNSYVPRKERETEERAVEGRIKEVAVKALPTTAFLTQVMNEFTQHMFPEPQQLHPVDIDRVYQQQPRPSQRSILNRAIFLPLQHFKQTLMEFFIKAESYAKPADPRIISTMNGTTKIDASKYMYALADHLHDASWYAFGKTPAEIAEKVSFICQQARTGVSLSDLARMDGHISNLLRDLDRQLMLQGFSKEHHEEILHMLSNLQNLQAVGKFGTKYDTLFAQCSGDPFTAIFNSMRNLFIHYLTFRCTKVGEEFTTPDNAWLQCLNGVLVGGDDGIAADVTEEPMQKACKLVGQVLEYDFTPFGQPGANFLSRFYTKEVWFGETNSCCDIKRQLLKFHLTTTLAGVTPIQKLVEKSRSFLISDRNTPIIGPFAIKVMQVANDSGYVKPPDAEAAALRSYLTRDGELCPVPNNYSEDYHHLLFKQLPITQASEEMFTSWLEQANTLEALLSPPCLTPREQPLPHPTRDIVVDGVEVPASTPPVLPLPKPPTVNVISLVPKAKPQQPHNSQTTKVNTFKGVPLQPRPDIPPLPPLKPTTILKQTGKYQRDRHKHEEEEKEEPTSERASARPPKGRPKVFGFTGKKTSS